MHSNWLRKWLRETLTMILSECLTTSYQRSHLTFTSIFLYISHPSFYFLLPQPTLLLELIWPFFSSLALTSSSSLLIFHSRTSPSLCRYSFITIRITLCLDLFSPYSVFFSYCQLLFPFLFFSISFSFFPLYSLIFSLILLPIFSYSQEESRALDEVIAADALADSEARFERASVARKAAAAVRYVCVWYKIVLLSWNMSRLSRAVNEDMYLIVINVNIGSSTEMFLMNIILIWMLLSIIMMTECYDQ